MKKVLWSFLLSAAFIMGGCSAGDDSQNEAAEGQTSNLPKEAAETVNAHGSMNVALINTEGESIGQAKITETAKGVKIHVTASGLEPGEKAIHIHETGKCEPPDFKTAGSHFNPKQKEHGFDNPKGYHAGDLPNIEVKSDGTVDEVIETSDVTLQTNQSHSILDEDGSALVIHEGPDDYKTDPAGNAGDRIACGVIDNMDQE